MGVVQIFLPTAHEGLIGAVSESGSNASVRSESGHAERCEMRR